MKKYSLSVFLAAASLCAYVHAADNPQLGAVMSTIAKDLVQVSEPTKATDPATVKDSAILAAVVRARTNAFLLQMIVDRRGLVEKGAFTPDELTPAGIAALPIAEAQKKLDLYADYLLKAKLKMGEAEARLVSEQKKSDPATRTFAPLKATLAELTLVMREAHGIFKRAP